MTFFVKILFLDGKMNRVSDAIVRRNPESVDFFVIDKTNAPKIDQDVSPIKLYCLLPNVYN